MALNSKQKILAMFNRERTPVPWLEIAVDETVILRTLGKPVSADLMETIKPIDISWDDKVSFAQKIGLDALGIYHWESFGSSEDDSNPVLDRYPKIHKREDLKELHIPRYDYEELHQQVIEANNAIRGTGLALFVEFAICLEYVVADLGFENLCLQLFEDPDFVEEIINRYTEYAIHLIEIYNRMPEIDFIWIGDDLAYNSGPFFSPHMYEKFIFPSIRRAVSKITKPWVFHSDGNILPLMDEIISWGPKAIHPFEPGAMNIFDVKKLYGDQISLIGNLDVDDLARAPQEIVVKKVKQLLDSFAESGGYGFSSGNALARYIDLDNLNVVSQTIKDFNKSFGMKIAY
jgi:uroporphyrinogen-III decarboxylase